MRRNFNMLNQSFSKYIFQFRLQSVVRVGNKSDIKTPVLDKHSPPLGIVFASFMAANVVGSRINNLLILRYKNISIRDTLIGNYFNCIKWINLIVLKWRRWLDLAQRRC